MEGDDNEVTPEPDINTSPSTPAPHENDSLPHDTFENVSGAGEEIGISYNSLRVQQEPENPQGWFCRVHLYQKGIIGEKENTDW